jgi:glycosyltransferase involved in cell wall biosynthesis
MTKNDNRIDSDSPSVSSSSNHLISVVTVCRNVAETIEDTLQSVAEQQKVDGLVEHLVVDGASQDDTLQIVQQFSAVRWISEPDEGISDAFNKGARLASGDYILFLNADDYLYDDTVLYDVVNFIKANRHPVWIVGDVAESKGGDLTLIQKRYPPSCWSLMFRNRIPHQAVFLQRKVLDEVGGFETRFKTSMDYDLFERLCARKIKPVYFPRVISVFSKEGLTSVTTPALVSETQEVIGRFRDNPFKRLVGHAYDQLRGDN